MHRGRRCHVPGCGPGGRPGQLHQLHWPLGGQRAQAGRQPGGGAPRGRRGRAHHPRQALEGGRPGGLRQDRPEEGAKGGVGASRRQVRRAQRQLLVHATPRARRRQGAAGGAAVGGAAARRPGGAPLAACTAATSAATSSAAPPVGGSAGGAASSAAGGAHCRTASSASQAARSAATPGCSSPWLRARAMTRCAASSRLSRR
jgi:hypothetical protein